MSSETLQKAREYEKKYSRYADQERPAFHVTGQIGWINDPNGFSAYKGEYHLFFQYHPYSVEWGPMHWGHAKTKDFIKWEMLPAAIAPDSAADCAGCFSGSAIELPDGKQLLMYTGVYRETREDGVTQDIQHQCLAIGDGLEYEKFEGNPVLTAEHLPEGASPNDFRDPHIWKEGDTYYSVVGNRPADGSGSLLVFESKDAFHWKFKTEMDACHNEYGRMWECPDIFGLDGKDVILVSPQEMVPLGVEFHAGFGTIVLLGKLDRETFKFQREALHSIDYGIDFYAPQTLLTEDGRRVMIAWMENWTNVGCKLTDCRIFGAMTLPRELSIKNHRLIQNPVRELENYRTKGVHYKNMIIHHSVNLAGVNGRHIDMTVQVSPLSGNGYNWFRMELAKDGEHGVSVRYKPGTNMIRVDRSRCGGRFDIVHTRDFVVFPHDGELKIRVVMDGNLLELFFNDGEQAATFKLYNKNLDARSITFEADVPVQIDVEKYDLVVE
ncbi:MAG: GH32 C-terminal domain-containing protein [Lachnospiraceae bacterium]|nr:GH32 C-terminal domain-containing protein [Lachnospiraceae bacterium]